jgi:MFS family permease
VLSRHRVHDPAVAHRYRWWTLAVLCLSLVLISIDTNILNVALPVLAKPTEDGGVGMGQIHTPATDSIMGAVPKERAGIGSAMNDTTRQIDGALGIAVLGSVMASRYGSLIGSSLADLPTDLVARVENSITEARTVALTESHGAFLSGMHLAMLAAAGVVGVAMVAVLRWLPARAHDDVEAISHPALGRQAAS